MNTSHPPLPTEWNFKNWEIIEQTITHLRKVDEGGRAGQELRTEGKDSSLESPAPTQQETAAWAPRVPRLHQRLPGAHLYPPQGNWQSGRPAGPSQGALSIPRVLPFPGPDFQLGAAWTISSVPTGSTNRTTWKL